VAHPIEIKKPIIPTLVHRGLRKRCPRCGDGRIFEKWHVVAPRCEVCNLELQAREGDCWGFMYVSTAVLTGFFFIFMLLYQPASLLLGRLGLFIAGLFLIGITLPYRKSLALALDFLVDPDSEHTSDTENN
jgi:uncharacterized protein (DUF983 family)